MLKFVLVLAVIGGGLYYWYTVNPSSFSSITGNASNDVSKAESKAKGYH